MLKILLRSSALIILMGTVFSPLKAMETKSSGEDKNTLGAKSRSSKKKEAEENEEKELPLFNALNLGFNMDEKTGFPKGWNLVDSAKNRDVNKPVSLKKHPKRIEILGDNYTFYTNAPSLKGFDKTTFLFSVALRSTNPGVFIQYYDGKNAVSSAPYSSKRGEWETLNIEFTVDANAKFHRLYSAILGAVKNNDKPSVDISSIKLQWKPVVELEKTLETKVTDVVVETDPIALKLRKSQEDAAPTSASAAAAAAAAAVLTSARADAQNATKKPPKAPPLPRPSQKQSGSGFLKNNSKLKPQGSNPKRGNFVDDLRQTQGRMGLTPTTTLSAVVVAVSETTQMSQPVDTQNAAKTPPKAPPPPRSSKKPAPLKISKLTTAAKKVAQPSKIAVTSEALSAMKLRSVTPGAQLTSTNTVFVPMTAPVPISTVKLRPVKKTPPGAQLTSINTASVLTIDPVLTPVVTAIPVPVDKATTQTSQPVVTQTMTPVVTATSASELIPPPPPSGKNVGSPKSLPVNVAVSSEMTETTDSTLQSKRTKTIKEFVEEQKASRKVAQGDAESKLSAIIGARVEARRKVIKEDKFVSSSVSVSQNKNEELITSNSPLEELSIKLKSIEVEITHKEKTLDDINLEISGALKKVAELENTSENMRKDMGRLKPRPKDLFEGIKESVKKLNLSPVKQYTAEQEEQKRRILAFENDPNNWTKPEGAKQKFAVDKELSSVVDELGRFKLRQKRLEGEKKDMVKEKTKVENSLRLLQENIEKRKKEEEEKKRSIQTGKTFIVTTTVDSPTKAITADQLQSQRLKKPKPVVTISSETQKIQDKFIKKAQAQQDLPVSGEDDDDSGWND